MWPFKTKKPDPFKRIRREIALTKKDIAQAREDDKERQKLSWQNQANPIVEQFPNQMICAYKRGKGHFNVVGFKEDEFYKFIIYDARSNTFADYFFKLVSSFGLTPSVHVINKKFVIRVKFVDGPYFDDIGDDLDGLDDGVLTII